MNKIDPPTLSIKKYYKSLISNSRKQRNGYNLKPYYEEIEYLLIYEEKEYITKGIRGSLNSITEKIIPSSHLSVKDMEYLYYKFQRDLPHYYYSLKSLANYNICPYCEKRDVTELDHYLPKVYYPMYVITPANLIPSCHECNKSKRTYTNPIIHPYFDNTTLNQWMRCELLIQNKSLIPRYKISFKNLNISSEDREKIINTVNALKLHKLYSTWASNLIANKIKHWKKVWLSGSNDDLIKFLQMEYDSINPEIYSINSYKKVFYIAFIELLKSNSANFSFLEGYN